jgi:type IV pilus assembly protein PilA
MRKQKKGFSLIELLIVVAIILIIAAIAIPNLMRSRIAANESSAVGTLRTINTAMVGYNSSYLQYPTDLSSLASPGQNAAATSTSAGLLDTTLAVSGTVTKSGYNFTYAPGDQQNSMYTSYAVNGNPVSLQTGNRYFYTDNTAVIRYNATAQATNTDTPIQ